MDKNLTIPVLSRNNDTTGLRSKSWEEFAEPGAPEFDFIFTVCDSAAGEVCPFWIGHPTTAHWGIRDPAAATGSDAELAAAFNDAYRMLHGRIARFTAYRLTHSMMWHFGRS